MNNTYSEYNVVIAPKSDAKNKFTFELVDGTYDVDALFADAAEFYNVDEFNEDDYVVVDYDCPDFIDDLFKKMKGGSLKNNVNMLNKIIDILEEAADYENDGYNMDDIVFLIYDGENPSNIFMVGDDSAWESYVEELVASYNIKSKDFIYNYIDWEKLTQDVKYDFTEVDLPSGDIAWIQ